MTIKQRVTNKKSVAKSAVYAMSLSALLALSACSGGDNTAADSTDSEAETTVVIEEPVADTTVPEVEVVTPVEEAVVPVEVIEVPADDAVTEVEATAEPEVLAADAGAKLYEAQCKACHASGLLAAPIFGDKAAWAPHLAKDIETLRMHSAKGFNKMPAQANATVSEAQVHAAVDYMVAAVS